MSDAIAGLNAALQGRYRIERELGEGGMATVYLARDLRHERSVALKVLKPELAAVVGAERFLAEIRTTAGLQHPHILPLFDSGEAAGLLYYVMPHVEGESLHDRLARERQLAVDEAVRLATAVAQALDHAHRRSVIHRDIKPSNILIHDGQLVIADFGIALAISAGGAGRLTETGLSLGTPHYMSPEQATGDLSIGPATDIYSLGCVLYEMLVGEPPYTGSTPQAILGKIITAEPVSATKLRRSVPPNVDAVIRKALERVPADRFATAGELARALGDAAFRHGSGASGPVASGGAWNRLSAGLAAACVGSLLFAAWSASALRRPESRVVARFDVTPAEGLRLLPSNAVVDIALSPDGGTIFFVGEVPGGGVQLWRRELRALAAVPVPGTEGATAPAVSPDGRTIAFAAGGAIRTLSLLGGPPVTVATPGASPTWGADGVIYFSRNGLIHRLPATGTDPEAFTHPSTNALHRFPDALPDGRGVLFTVVIGPPAQSRIAVVGRDGGEPREILTGAMARYSATGHIVYTTARGALMAVPFDVRRLETSGPPVAIAEGVTVGLTSASRFALSPTGTLLYAVGAGSATELVWVARDGQEQVLDSTWMGDISSPALAPDGARAAVAIQSEASMDIWIKQLDRGPATRLTLDGSRSDYPTWTPDGASVTFTSNRAGPSFDLWTKRADGSGEPVLERDDEWAIAEGLWSPDGAWFVHRTSSNERGAGDILASRRGSGQEPLPLAVTSFQEFAPAISPDGRWLAYASLESGRFEVFVVPFPDAGTAKWQISVDGGTEPAWSRTGSELFYRNGRGDMVAVRLAVDASFRVGSARVLFPARSYLANAVHRQYDVAPDDARFLMVRPVAAGVERRLILVQGFAEELRARVPR